jgi:hypothetical protein
LIVISPKSEWWSSRKQKIANAGEDAGDGVGGQGEERNSYVMLVEPRGNQYGRFSKKLKIKLSYDTICSCYSPPEVDLKEFKSAYNRGTCKLLFTAALSQLPSFVISLGGHQPMSE